MSPIIIVMMKIEGEGRPGHNVDAGFDGQADGVDYGLPARRHPDIFFPPSMGWKATGP